MLRFKVKDLLVAVALTGVGCDSTKQVNSTPAPAATVAGNKGEIAPTPDNPTLRIPLESIVATSQVTASERGIHHRPKFVDSALAQVYSDTSFNGASNLFLVDAPSVEGAVAASTGVLAGARAADVPAPMNMPDAPRGNYWLVVFLGIRGSDPTNWLVDSVTVNGNLVRFSYHQQGSGAATKNLHSYLYWMQIGNLASGTYKLELYDTQLHDVTLMRRVEIKAPGHR